MSTEPELVFLMAFPCTHCKAELSIAANQPGTWVRCPKCGRASRAPDSVVKRSPVPIKAGEDVFRIDPAPDPKPMTPVAVASLPAQRSLLGLDRVSHEPANPWRVACGAALVLAVTGAIFAHIETSELGIVGFSMGSVIMLIILIRTAR